MPTNYTGEIAALLASVCFAIGPTMNTLATQRVSVGTLNRARVLITLLLLLLPHWALYGSLVPTGLQSHHWLWLGLSSLFSLVLGDTLLFAAFSQIGTRVSMLVISSAPVINTGLAWLILGEKLAWIQVAGILTTIAGIAWVVSDRDGKTAAIGRPAYIKGILLALGSALFHAIGSITAKLGLADGLPALSAHLVRIFISLVILLFLAVIQGQISTTVREIKASPVSLKHILAGAIFGPMAGMWLTLFALQNTDVGVVSSLTSLPPVLLLPVGRYYFKEQIGLRAVVGSLVAVVGVALLFVA